MIRLALPLLLLASCGGHVQTAYRTDREACHESAESEVQKHNAKRAIDWFASPVRRWSQIGEATDTCMQTKGYGRLRWCTPAELANSKRSGNVLVTASGVQCTDPPTRQP